MLTLNPNHTFIIGEIGINHNGDINIAKQLIDVAKSAGCDAVKFQKRTPHMSLHPSMWEVERETPWGSRMTYIEYRKRIEFSSEQYIELFEYCKLRDIVMFASPWDTNAADTLYCMDMPVFKIASASVTNFELIRKVASFHMPVIMSTGMCTRREIWNALNILYPTAPWIGLLVCTSSYPAKVEDLNLNRIHSFRQDFHELIIGYSGHETGIWMSLCAVAMGARILERHITLDKSMPGSDQAASLEPHDLHELVNQVRRFELARGSEEIRVLPCEEASIKRLRG